MSWARTKPAVIAERRYEARCHDRKRRSITSHSSLAVVIRAAMGGDIRCDPAQQDGMPVGKTRWTFDEERAASWMWCAGIGPTVITTSIKPCERTRRAA